MAEIETLIDSSGILLTKDVIKAGISKSTLYAFIKSRGFERVAQGIYVSPECWEDKLYVLHKRCPNGVISHDEALYYYGLLDREPCQITITVYTGYGAGRLIKDGIKVYTIKKDLLELGKKQVLTNWGHTIPIYDLERTICDLIRSRSQMEIQDFVTALKGYVRRKDKNINKLMEYAKQFHIEKKTRELISIL